MNTAWNFILAIAVTLTSAAGIVGGEVGKGELRLAEAATSFSVGPDALVLVSAGTKAAAAAQ